MKRLFALFVAAAISTPAHALLGMGDITYDPQSYAQLTKIFEESKKMYEATKQQLDTMASMERTIREAQQAQETLANTHFRDLAGQLRPDGNNTKTAAGLRAELANLESKGGQSAGYVTYQMSRIKNLENLELLQKVSAENVGDATGRVNQATAERITAQSTAALASLAAAEEQRKVQDDYARQAAANAHQKNMKDSAKVYESMGK